MQDEFSELFDDDGELAIPTIRGEANLDIEDYEGYSGRSSILDDGLQEDVPSTPGRNPGAAAATDVEGTDDFDLLSVPGGMDAPGMKVTEFGSSPWGPGSDSGYRPYSQQRTDMELRALGAANEEHHKPRARPVERDSMHDEPEVINAVAVEEPVPWEDEWHGMDNRQPSNAQVDPMTIYDRSSYEYDESSQDTIGNGIFSMEEGVTWRPRDGIFANQYAMPAYLAEEDELGVQQSRMWDSTAGEWRVTQPSAGGVTLARKVKGLRPPPAGMRPEITGPRSHIEAFGRDAAKCILAEAQLYRGANRGKFLASALEMLGPGGAARAKVTADKLVAMGYRRDIAFEDAVAHLVMHAAVEDMKGSGGSSLPRLDRLARTIRRNAGALRNSAVKHVEPLCMDPSVMRNDIASLHNSPSGRAMADVSSNGQSPTAAPSEPGILRPRNLLIAGGLGVGAYLLFSNRKAIAKNIKKWTK